MHHFIRATFRLGLNFGGGALLAFALSGCGGPMQELPVDPAPAPCSAPAGQVISDIQSVIDWINAMPKPLTLPCFTQSLPRPLKVYTTLGGVSAQPGIGPSKPRVFIFIDKMILSVVPGENYPTQADGSPQDPTSTKYNQLELSYAPTNGISSIKGELRFPVREKLAATAAYDHIEYAPGYTLCSLCHRDENKAGEINGVSYYTSDRKIPRDFQNLSIARREYEYCDHQADPYHCDMMSAIFAHGEVVWQEFPEILNGHF